MSDLEHMYFNPNFCRIFLKIKNWTVKLTYKKATLLYKKNE
jgi:hypothetical protein